MPNLLTYYKKPLLVHEGKMQWLWDHEGRRYLDFLGGIVTIGVGHCHPSVLATRLLLYLFSLFSYLLNTHKYSRLQYSQALKQCASRYYFLFGKLKFI